MCFKSQYSQLLEKKYPLIHPFINRKIKSLYEPKPQRTLMLILVINIHIESQNAQTSFYPRTLFWCIEPMRGLLLNDYWKESLLRV